MQPCDKIATLQFNRSEAINAPFEAIFNHGGDGILLLDEEYRIQLVNSAFATLCALTPYEITGKRLSSFVLAEDSLQFETVLGQVTRTGKKQQIEVKINRSDNTILDLEISIAPLHNAEGHVTNLVCIARDITERKVAELAIQEERNLLRTVIDAVPESIYVKDRQHRLVLNNLAHKRAIESFSSAEQIGKTVFELYPPQLATQFYANEVQLFQSSAPFFNIEENSLSPEGDSITTLTTKIPLHNLQGELVGLVGITRDVSELKAGEEALRRSERELRESQKKLQMVLDTIPVRVFWKDRDSVLQGCNRLFAQDAGFDNVAEFLAHEQANWLVKQISPDRYRKEDLTVIESGIPLLEYEQLFKRSTGEELIIQTSKFPLRDEAGKIVGLLGLYMDITARREAEQALTQKYEEEQEMQGYLKALHNVTLQLTQTETLDEFYHDVVALGLQHFAFERIGFYLNRMGKAEATGTYGTDINRRVVSEYHLKRDLQELTGILKTAHQDNERFIFLPEATLYANGAQVGTGQCAIAALSHHDVLGWLSIDNGIDHKPITKAQLDILALYAITVGSLLTRKEAETALRESEEKFRIFIESAPIATFVTDEKGTITLVNCETERLFGYKRDELLDQSVKLLIPKAPGSAASFHSLMLELQAKGNQTEAIELSARHKTGVFFPVDLQLRYIDTHPQPLTMHLVIDITQRKQAESALRQSLAQEKELSQLKSHFISMASHEFRTPLTTILSATETLSVYRDKMSVYQINARLEKIRQQVLHMRDLMEDVLHLERMQSRRAKFKPALGNLDLLCRDIIEEFESQPECRGRTIYSSTLQLTPLFFDEHLIRQVLNNLLSNALKYSSPDRSVYVDLLQDSTHVQLTVRDEGIGIPAADLKHIFEPFHRAQNVGTTAGTGLGLSITKEAVDLHKGILSLESQVGVGTTFVVKLPTVMAKE